MEVGYITHSGDDLLVVNSARVSFDKQSEWANLEEYLSNWREAVQLELKDGDKKLIKYLATHGHWTPFSHPQITLRIKAPIFVRTQCFKHKIGFTENEVSRRYVDDEPEFYTPEVWRGRPKNGIKQGSSDEEVKWLEGGWLIEPEVKDLYQDSLEIYKELLKSGVAPEQARMVLPQSMYTQWVWTGSLAAYARFYKLRSDPHAQKEIQELAEMVADIIDPLFPEAWSALTT